MDTFQALSEPKRRQIIQLLATKGQLSATQISDNFNISPPAISQHLKILTQVDLIKREIQAQKRLYQINLEQLDQIETWIQKMKKLWNQRFDNLDKLLESQKTN